MMQVLKKVLFLYANESFVHLPHKLCITVSVSLFMPLYIIMPLSPVITRSPQHLIFIKNKGYIQSSLKIKSNIVNICV